MLCLHHSCQGESHKAGAKVCQDASYSACAPDLSIAIVCDGHGGVRYFRSDVGARMAIEVTLQCVSTFVREVDPSLFQGKPFTQKAAPASEAVAGLTKDTLVDKSLRQLFSAIIYNWQMRVEEHAAQAPLTDEERARVPSAYLDEFAQGLGLEKTYGCTLMSYVFTPAFWLAFHIGDGKCIAFDEGGGWSEPIPWDERCFLNKTTSLCDAEALSEFRYCYCGDGSRPVAVFLGSDGIDDSFGQTENMVNFYIQVVKLLATAPAEEALENLCATLPELSRIGSQDDMSVACVYDEALLPAACRALTVWQKGNVEREIQSLDGRIAKLQGGMAELEERGIGTRKDVIDYYYVQKDLDQAYASRLDLVRRLEKFDRELGLEPADVASPSSSEAVQEEPGQPDEGECSAPQPEDNLQTPSEDGQV